jgi:hypothetical protein
VPLFEDLPLLGGLADISISEVSIACLWKFYCSPFKVLFLFFLVGSSKVVIAGNNNIVMS